VKRRGASILGDKDSSFAAIIRVSSQKLDRKMMIIEDIYTVYHKIAVYVKVSLIENTTKHNNPFYAFLRTFIRN
jgi:hypothetical protein